MKIDDARPLNILLVEDSDSDVEIARRTFAKSGVSCRLDVAQDGSEALETLHRYGVGDAGAALPDLVLLDLGLPGLGGVDVLEGIKADPRLANVPIVVVTGSRDRTESRRCVELGINLYLTKPVKIVDVVYMVLSVHKYWAAIDDIAGRRA